VEILCIICKEHSYLQRLNRVQLFLKYRSRQGDFLRHFSALKKYIEIYSTKNNLGIDANLIKIPRFLQIMKLVIKDHKNDYELKNLWPQGLLNRLVETLIEVDSNNVKYINKERLFAFIELYRQAIISN
jgi:hypothetical protein